MAFDISNLNAYVDENREGLIGKSLLVGKTIDVINHMAGVKGSAKLNLLDVGVTFQDGSNCGFNASGDDEFSQREMVTKEIKVEKEWCVRTLIGTWAQENARVKVRGGEELPFEEFILAKIQEAVNEKIEKVAWQGLTTPAITGLLGQLFGASITPTALTASGDYAKVLEVYDAIAEEVLDKAVIFVDAARFRGLVQGLVAANLYHYNPNAPVDEVIIPGTNTRVIKVNGLNQASVTTGGSTYSKFIVAADPAKMFYGYDVEDDARTFILSYDEKNDSIWFRMVFNMGFQIAIPSEVTFYSE